MTDACGLEVAAANASVAQEHGDWLPCSRPCRHYGDHQHQESGYTWEQFPVGTTPATGEWPIRGDRR
jgi:hypothetical protein